MNAKTDACHACGSARVVSGTLQGFVLSNAKKRPWLRFFMSTPERRPGPVVDIREDGSAVLCLECGRVTGTSSVDLKNANKTFISC